MNMGPAAVVRRLYNRLAKEANSVDDCARESARVVHNDSRGYNFKSPYTAISAK